jgi:HlyD family secretion protein
MNKIAIFLSLIIASVIIWVGVTFYKAYEPKPAVFQGEIDAQTYNISSKVAGRISKIAVKKGDILNVGDFVFSIKSDEVEAKLKQAIASKEAANAIKQKANKGARVEEIKAAYDQYQKALSAQKLMKNTYNRIKKLYNEGVVSEQKHDEVYTKYQASIYTTSAAKQLYEMAKKGARVEDKLAANAKEKVYEGKVEEVEAYVRELNLYSFHKGEVTSILIQEGELAPTGFPVVSITDMSDVWAKFYIREDFLKFFKKGTILKVKIPAIGDKLYDFRVEFISVMGDYATWRASEAGSGYDMKSFEIHLRPIKPIKDLRVGMSTLIEL